MLDHGRVVADGAPDAVIDDYLRRDETAEVAP